MSDSSLRAPVASSFYTRYFAADCGRSPFPPLRMTRREIASVRIETFANFQVLAKIPRHVRFVASRPCGLELLHQILRGGLRAKPFSATQDDEARDCFGAYRDVRKFPGTG